MHSQHLVVPHTLTVLFTMLLFHRQNTACVELFLHQIIAWQNAFMLWLHSMGPSLLSLSALPPATVTHSKYSWCPLHNTELSTGGACDSRWQMSLWKCSRLSHSTSLLRCWRVDAAAPFCTSHFQQESFYNSAVVGFYSRWLCFHLFKDPLHTSIKALITKNSQNYHIKKKSLHLFLLPQ